MPSFFYESVPIVHILGKINRKRRGSFPWPNTPDDCSKLKVLSLEYTDGPWSGLADRNCSRIVNFLKIRCPNASSIRKFPLFHFLYISQSIAFDACAIRNKWAETWSWRCHQIQLRILSGNVQIIVYFEVFLRNMWHFSSQLTRAYLLWGCGTRSSPIPYFFHQLLKNYKK